ncbi:histidine kinase [Caulobacter segnis]|uniref:sensor histidine kinase n=1 Tax=Caulobacter segnis TaxID=88688 RepID=UPI00240F00DC|nr:histidine kinase [Caulobacter segnis]MDG2523526.1 histidine kinase [Caulobacter segnis]
MKIRRPIIDKGALVLILIMVAVVDVLITIRSAADGYPPKLSHLPAEVLAYSTMTAVTYGMYLAIEGAGRRFRLTGRIVAAVVTAVIASFVHLPMISLIFRHMTDFPTRSWSELYDFGRIYTMVIPFMFNGAGLVAYCFHRDVLARERQLAEAQQMAQEAQLLALRYQINPHFLFNTLNAASTLVLERRNQAAETMLLRLAAFFRLTLTLDPRQAIPLVREIELQRTYLAIEQTRFGDELKVRIKLPPVLEHALVPALLLQPLVENAVKHTLGGEGAEIFIAAHAVGGTLRLEVTNTIQRHQAPGTGTGLRNVAERLAAEYGEAASLDIEPREDRFRVILTLPLVLAERPRIAA